MALDFDLDSSSPVRQALRRFRRDDAVGVKRAADRRALWQQRLRDYVNTEIGPDAPTGARVPRESAGAHLPEG
jgi:hypothetical protein